MADVDLTNVVFFPEPTIEQLQEQQQKVDDLREEAAINYQLHQHPDDLKRIQTLEGRASTIYQKLVDLQREDILATLNSA